MAREEEVSRLWFVMAVAAGLSGCSGPVYTFEGSSLAKANERAERYCFERQDTAHYEGIEHRGSARIEIYRCEPPRVIASR